MSDNPNQPNPFSNNTKQPTLGTFIPTIANPTFSVNPSGNTATLYLRYPTSLQKCVTDLSLSITSSNGNGVDINYISNNIWEINGVTLNNENIDFSMTAIGVAPTVLNGCDPSMSGVTVDTSFSIIAQVPPTKPSPYKLEITNYGGPPQFINQKWYKGDASGPVTMQNSYLQQVAASEYYSEKFIDNFVKYNAQSKIFIDPIDNSGYHLPIDIIYVSINSDPVQQGASEASGGKIQIYPENIKKNYIYTDSSSNINGSINSDDLFKTWRDPPLLKFYQKLIQYNWNVFNDISGYANKQYVKLGMTVYGSAKLKEEWWFDVSINDQGELYTIDPNSPKFKPSIIDHIPNDGNNDYNYWKDQSSDDPNCKTDCSCVVQRYKYLDISGPKAVLAGWNCLERWFKYVAYCNQRLRVIIDNSLSDTSNNIVTDDGKHTLRLSDIGTGKDKFNPLYCQISSITTDAEGNGFQNITYTDKKPVYGTKDDVTPCSYYWAEWFKNVKPYQGNAAIKALWNKWVNQHTDHPPTPKSSSDPSQKGWPMDNNGKDVWPGISNLKANHTRYRMPDISFDLPCSISNTKATFIKNMGTSDFGSPNFDAVTGLFHEVYDTSNETKPYLCLGADKTMLKNCQNSDPSNPQPTHIKGIPFTEEYRKLANPTIHDVDTSFVQQPESWLTNGIFQDFSGMGTWDNCVLTGVTCAVGGFHFNNGNLENWNNPSGADASYAVTGWSTFNDHTYPNTPRILTSKYDPWTTKDVLWKPKFSYVGNIGPAGWTLEGSRYDLYHGMWAKQAAIANETEINYNDVFQGENGADGAVIWSDLSTGLKPYAATRMTNVREASGAACQLWMLSCQSGPFVKNAGIRSAHSAKALRDFSSNVRRCDYLTFMCPDSAIAEYGYWPGWKGMRNQWYGQGTTAYANRYKTWATDQMKVIYTDQNTWLPPKPTKSTEDNFGVFYDIGIQEAAWAGMARDFRGEGLNKNGICTLDSSGSPIYKYDDTNKPRIGCYELAFIPLSWYRPGGDYDTFPKPYGKPPKNSPKYPNPPYKPIQNT